MTPPKIQGFQNYCDPEGLYQQPVQSADDAQGQQCSLDAYTLDAYTAAKPQEDPALLKPQLARRFQEAKALAQRSLSSEQAFAESQGFSASSLLKGIFEFVVNSTPLALWACGGSGKTQDSPPEIPMEPPSEDPDPVQFEPPEGMEGETDDGIGVLNATLGNSDCDHPVDMDADGSKLLMTCGDDIVATESGAGMVEFVNPASGKESTLQFPTELEGDANRPVKLSSLALGDGDVVYAGFSPAGSAALFESDTAKFADSGIFVASQNDASNPSIVNFDLLRVPFQLPLANAAGAVDADGNEPALNGFVPNSPVSMVRSGDMLYVLNANRVLNFEAARANAMDPEAEFPVLDYAPATVHAYSIAGDGSLTPAAAGDQPVEVDGVIKPGHAYMMVGSYNPVAMTSVGDGRLAIVTQGVGEDNPSVLHVLNSGDFLSGLGAEDSDIPLTDSAGLNFTASNSPHIAIVDVDGTPHAVLGSSDGSGRVAVVNLSTDPVEGDRVKFFGIFDDDANVASVVAHGDRAYVISDTGDLRVLYLFDNEAEGVSYGSVGPVESLANTSEGTPYVAALLADSLVAARPGAYSKAEITPGPASAE